MDRDGNAYVVGNTKSTDFPVTPGAFQQTLKGTRDGFITKLDPTGSQLVYSPCWEALAPRPRRDYWRWLSIASIGYM